MSVNLKYSWIFKLGCASMFALIGVGARYGHRGKLNPQQTNLFYKAQLYHLINNIGLISSSLVASSSIAFRIAVGGFIGGNLIFVLPLYYIAVKERNDILSKTMPVGGILMLVSWVSLIFA